MKKRKVLSFLTAAVLAVGAVPFSVIHAAAADETYVQGDVDMDGYITGHDAAMVKPLSERRPGTAQRPAESAGGHER